MRIAVHTADFAQTDERGKLNAIGLGWSVVPSPLPMHAVAVVFGVEWSEANMQHQFTLELVDADGNPVSFEESGVPAVRVEGGFEQGRPPGLIVGSELRHVLAVNLPPGMPLAQGRYEYRVSVGSGENAEQASASFSVVAQ